MTCHQVRERFDPSDVAPAEVSQHLTRCADCRAYVEDMRHLYGLLAEWRFERVPVPEDFESRLRQRLAERRAPSSVKRILLAAPSMAIAASLLVAAAVGVIYFRLAQPTPSPLPSSPSSSETATSEPRATTGTPPSPSPALASRRSPTPPIEPPSGRALSVSSSSPPPHHPTAGSPPLVMEPTSPGVVLFIRDEENDEESIVPIPSVVFGSRPLFPLSASTRLVRDEKRGVL